MTDRPLQGRWALILGASSGFGAATGKALAAAGMNIAGVHLDLRSTLPQAKAVIAEIEAQGVTARFFNTNAADPDRRTRVLDELAAQMGPGETVHVLMHSLAFGTLKPLIPPLREDGSPGAREDAIDPAQMDMTLNVMAHSLVYWTQELRSAGLLSRGAQVYAMTSAGAHRVWPTYGAVSAAKAALEAHVRQLAVELAPSGIAVNALQAGVTDTPAARRIPGSDAMFAAARAANPGGRLTQPGDVASILVALSRSESAWMTGNVLRIDGGEDLV